MRIGFEATLLGGHETGVEKAIRSVLLALVRQCVRDEFVVFIRPAARSSLPVLDNVRFVNANLASLARGARIAWQQAVAPVLGRRSGLDVFHSPGYVLSPWMPCPSVVTVYDTIAFDHPHLTSTANRRHYRWAVPRGVRRADCVVAPSACVAGRIVSLFGADASKVRVIPLGIDESFREASFESRRSFPDAWEMPERFGLLVGTKERKKNAAVVVSAFAQSVAARQLGLHLVLVGKDGGETRRLQELARRLDVEDRVRFLSYAPQEALVALYNAASFLAYPSWTEGFGLPPLEAMACGTPTLVSDIPAHRETAGDAAVLIRANDVDAWTRAIDVVVASESFQAQRIAAGRERVRQYTWSAHAASLRAIYGELVEARVHGRVWQRAVG